jgi:hypothetical protein
MKQSFVIFGIAFIVYWFWGDTSRMNYPLGLFRMAGATTPAPALSRKIRLRQERITTDLCGYVG